MRPLPEPIVDYLQHEVAARRSKRLLVIATLCRDRHLVTGWASYRYDIHDYEATPDWLNSRYWANPKRWGRERW